MSDTVYIAGDAVEMNGELIEYGATWPTLCWASTTATSARYLCDTERNQHNPHR